MTKHWSSDNDRKSPPAAHTSEGSALFSLNELKAKAEAAVRGNKPKDRDDNSGLIDLKAMMIQAEQERATEADSALHVTPHLPVYPFGAPAETPQPAPAAMVEETEGARAWRRPKRGRAASLGMAVALLGVAAIAAAAISAGLGAFDVPQTALATPIPTALQWSVAPAAMALATPENPEVAQPGSAADADAAKESDSAIATARAPKEIPHIAKAPVLNKTATPTAAAPKPPVSAPTPANDACKGDLMCAMQRAVKK